MRVRISAVIFVLLFFATITFVQAQNKKAVKASQIGTVSQFVADTQIVVEYSRPVARG